MRDRNKFSHKACGVYNIVECTGYEYVLNRVKISLIPLGVKNLVIFFTKWSSNEDLGTKSIGRNACRFICRHIWHAPLVCSFPRCRASWTSCLWCNGENTPQRSTCDQGPTPPSCLWRYSTCRRRRTAIFYGTINSELNTECLGWEKQKIVLFGHRLFASPFFTLKPQKKAWPLSLCNQPKYCRRTWLMRKQKTELNFDTWIEMAIFIPQLWMTPVLLPPALAALWPLLELSRKSRTNWIRQIPTPPGCSPWAPPNIHSIHQNLQRQVYQSMPSIQTDF